MKKKIKDLTFEEVFKLKNDCSEKYYNQLKEGFDFTIKEEVEGE